MSKKDDGVVRIHGKEYLTVARRVSDFRLAHPEHGLTTAVVLRDAECVVMQATITDPAGRVIATGHAEEYRKSSQINRTSALENAETSAIGRALAAFGIGGTEFASANEVENAIHQQGQGHSQADAVSPAPTYNFPEGPATGITMLKGMCRDFWREVAGCGDSDELETLLCTKEAIALFQQCENLENPAHREIWEGDGKDNPGLHGFIQMRRGELKTNILQAG